jgi:hypothetical protein
VKKNHKHDDKRPQLVDRGVAPFGGVLFRVLRGLDLVCDLQVFPSRPSGKK